MQTQNHLKINLIGFAFGIVSFIAAVGFDITQVLQYLGWLSQPLDEILIYSFSLCISIPFLLEMLALHCVISNDKKFWTSAVVIFASMYVVFVTSNYVVQLASVVPMKISGAATHYPWLIQTPHSMFWDYDAIGYIFMGLSTLFAIPVFLRKGRERWVRYSLMMHALVTPLIGIVYFYPVFSPRLFILGFPWGFTAPLAILMVALFLKNGMKENY